MKKKSSRHIEDDYLKEVISMSDKDVDKITTVYNAISKRYDAEASKESQLKMRILFQRTAPEMLPFVIYCITFGPVAAYSYSQIVKLTETQFYFGLGGLVIIMCLPALLLPRLPFKNWFAKKQNNAPSQTQENEKPPPHILTNC